MTVEITLDPLGRRLRGPTGGAYLTPTVALLLDTLVGGGVVTYAEVARALWGSALETPSERNLIRQHAFYLRRSLAAVGAGHAIRTITGTGLRIADGHTVRRVSGGAA